MKRHAALEDLSRDHHDILLHAKRLLGEDARKKPAHALEQFVLYRDAVLTHHLDEEERFVAPRVDPALAGRFRMSRHQIDNAVGAEALGSALRLHARFCEDAMFPGLEGELGDAGWKAFHREAGTFRKSVRPKSIGKGKGEECFL